MKTIAKVVDEVPKNVMEICVVFITSCMPNTVVNTENVKDVKNIFDSFPFASLPDKLKL